jgi:hypothetical protein
VVKRFIHADRSKDDSIVGVRTQSLVGHFRDSFVAASTADHGLSVLPAYLVVCASTADGSSHFIVESIGNGDVFSKATDDRDVCNFQRYVWNVTRDHLCPWDCRDGENFLTAPQLNWPSEFDSLSAPFLSTIKRAGVPPSVVQGLPARSNAHPFARAH